MKIVIFGLSISSSWGNGHATLWRGLCAALAKRGHTIVFFEKDVPYYAAHRDLHEIENGKLILYREWADVEALARKQLSDADVAIATSFCPDAIPAERLMLEARALRVFYDLDAPVTLKNFRDGLPVDYLAPHLLAFYDMVLSYTGGGTLQALQTLLSAKRVYPLYGSVDPRVHHATTPVKRYRSDLSYLGTFAADRQQSLEKLVICPAAERPEKRFLIGGALYPEEFPWKQNIFHVPHIPPEEHAAFYSSSRLTLNITRRSMAEAGYCPSGRLFEAAACGAVIVSDMWAGLDSFFSPQSEIVIAEETSDILAAMDLSDCELETLRHAARERVLGEHTASHRAVELEEILSAREATTKGGD